MDYKLLIINPGSTSTKISLFVNKQELFQKSQFHDAPVLLQFPHVNGQVPFRYKVILDMLEKEGEDPSRIDVFVGRGGSACTQPSGVTVIDQKLYDDTEAAVGGSEHAAKLGVMIDSTSAPIFSARPGSWSPAKIWAGCWRCAGNLPCGGFAAG